MSKKQQAREDVQASAVSEIVVPEAEAETSAPETSPDVLISVSAVAEVGFCRAGRRYSRNTPTLLHSSELKPGELERLQKEHVAKNLIVKFIAA